MTGTPIENRIDELYSIVDFIDPQRLGPLFLFNREYYELDDRGRPLGYRNLDKLRRKVSPVLLRRRKSEVETELPSRTDRNHFVAMAPSQREAYADHEAQVARLAAIAKRRPLTKQEQDKRGWGSTSRPPASSSTATCRGTRRNLSSASPGAGASTR